MKDTVYKYCSIKTAYLILKDNKIKLNPPNNFNDPYDTNLSFSEKDLEKVRITILNFILDKELKNAIFDKEKINQSKLKQFMFFEKIQKKLLKKRNILSEAKPALNYVKIIRKYATSELKKMSPDSENKDSLINFLKWMEDKKMIEIFKEAILNAREQILISCFSKKPNSTLMWSHYADNSRGVCLGFTNEYFADVIYSKKRQKIKFNRLIPLLLPYFPDIITNKIEILRNNPVFLSLSKLLLSKSKAWSYEKEVRAIFPIIDPGIINENSDYFYKMKKLTSITAGYRVSDHEINKLIAIARNKNVPLYKMKLSNTTFDLIKEKIKI